MDTLTNKKMEISALFEVKRCLTDLIRQCDKQIGNKAKELQALELLQRNEKELDTAKESMEVAKTLSAKKKKSKTTQKKTKEA
jgi:hypothetical protein